MQSLSNPSLRPDTLPGSFSQGTGAAPRTAEPYSYGAGLLPAVRLALHPVPAGLTYSVISYWEEQMPGQVQRTTLKKNIRLAATGRPGGPLRLAYEVAATEFQKPDLTSFERVLLLVTDLYRRLELRITPLGQMVEVLNEAAMHQTWEQVKAELVRRSGGEDEFTQVLISGVEEQLGRPEAVLDSLRLDYFFSFLLQNVYEQRFETGFRYSQPLCFPQFFAGQDLWFQERLELAVPTSPERVALRLTGQLDPARTDLGEVARQVAAAWQLLVPDGAGAAGELTAPDALRFAYEATAELDAGSGWPMLVEASVRCWVSDGYGKEYFIRIEQQAPTP